MQIRTVTYTRKKNLGNYQNEDLTATMELLDGESPVIAYLRTRAFVEASLGYTQDARNTLEAAQEMIELWERETTEARPDLLPVEHGWIETLAIPATARTARQPRN